MESNFEKNFESNKIKFKTLFGIEWNENPTMYLQYMETLYISSLTEVVFDGMNKILNNQEDIKRKIMP